MSDVTRWPAPACSKQLLCALTWLPATVQSLTLSIAMVRRLMRLPLDDEAIALRFLACHVEDLDLACSLSHPAIRAQSLASTARWPILGARGPRAVLREADGAALRHARSEPRRRRCRKHTFFSGPKCFPHLLFIFARSLSIDAACVTHKRAAFSQRRMSTAAARAGSIFNPEIMSRAVAMVVDESMAFAVEALRT